MFAQNFFSHAIRPLIGQAVQVPPIPLLPVQPTMQDLSTTLNTTLTQQAVALQQAEAVASNLWWSQNWPIVAGGVGLLALGVFLVARK
jgi:hypothetical protein